MKIKGYEIPNEFFYMKEHAWLFLENPDVARIGITDYAQKALREITFLYLPKKNLEVRRLQVVATVESVKAVSEIYAPVSGQIMEINEKLVSKPRLINEDPYSEGWILVIRPNQFQEESRKLLKAKQYAEYVRRLTRIDRNLLVHRWRRKR